MDFRGQLVRQVKINKKTNLSTFVDIFGKIENIGIENMSKITFFSNEFLY